MEVLAKEIKQEKEIKVCIKKEEQKLYFQMTGSYVPKILRNAHTYTHTHLLEPINKIIKGDSKMAARGRKQKASLL
jgi:hypothetical protein